MSNVADDGPDFNTDTSQLKPSQLNVSTLQVC